MEHTPGFISGTREELQDSLLDSAEGWSTTFGRDDLAQQCEAGARSLEDGKDEVQVGHIRYIVSK